MWDPYAEFETAVLPNGLTVHAAHWPGKEWIKMGFVIHSGAYHDPVGQEGTAHFVEHLVSMNADVPCHEIEAFFNELGGSVDLGGTSYHATKYELFVPIDKEYLERALEIFGTMLMAAELKDAVELERSIIVEEVQRKYPVESIRELACLQKRVLYGGYWRSRLLSPAGSVESVQTISQEALQAYYDTHYTPRNMQVVSIGGITVQELTPLLEQSLFGSNKDGKRQPPLSPLADFPPPTENRHIVELSKYLGGQLARTCAYGSIGVIPGTISHTTLKVLQRMVRRVLFDEVREVRGWTYHITAGVDYYQEIHEFSITCDSLSLEAVDKIEIVVNECIVSLADRTDLFKQVKRERLAEYRMVDVTAEGMCSNVVDELGRYQKIITFAEEIAELQALTMEDIRSALLWLRPERRWTILRVP